MPRWIRNLATGAASHVPALLTLGVLAALGVVGARNEWKLPALQKLRGPESEQKEEPEDAIQLVPAPPSGSETSEAATNLGGLKFSSPEAVHKADIQVAPIVVQDVVQSVTAYGMLDYQPALYAQLNSRVSGTIWRVLKELSEPVKQGDVLALIESSDVGQAKTDFQQALRQYQLERKKFQNTEDLKAKNLVPEIAYLEAQTALRDARVRMTNAYQKLLNLGFYFHLKEVENFADDELHRYLHLLGIPESVRKGIDTETLTSNLVPMTAPFDGQVVSHPHAAPGEVVNVSLARDPMFIVADVHALHIDLDIQPSDVRWLKVGQVVQFVPEGQQGEVAVGQLAHISPEVNEKTRHVEAHAEVKNPDGHLRPHTFGQGKVLVGAARNAVVVPDAALQSDGKTTLVFVQVSDTEFQARPVTLGLHDAERKVTQVLGAVREGEQVVTTGSYALKSELLRERISGGDLSGAQAHGLQSVGLGEAA